MLDCKDPIELRSALPIETRDEGDGDDPLAAATQAVEELRGSVETFRTETNARMETELRAVTTRLEQVETRMQRPGAGAAEHADEAAETERRSFLNYVRRGTAGMVPDEVRALRVSDDTSGGYLAPPTFLAEMLRNLVEMSPIRQAARVGTMSSGAIMLPRRTAGITAKWVGETEQRPPTQPAYGLVEMAAHEMAAYVDVSMWLLEDAAIDIERELAFDFAEEFGRLEGVAFLNGDGIKKPVGIMADPNVGYVANGHATNLSADSLIRLMYSLPAFYRNRGSWLLNGTTLAAVRLFKDTAGQYLWREGLTEGQPATLLGRPIIEAVDMGDVEANTFPVVYGDFESAYRIYDRIAPSVRRYDDAQLAEYGLVRFHGRRRLAAGVVRPEAIRKLKMATS